MSYAAVNCTDDNNGYHNDTVIPCQFLHLLVARYAERISNEGRS